MTALPPRYAAWMDDALGGALPGESLATCGDCAMAPPPGRPATGGLYFLADVKCCGYVPTLPNFLVGGILADRDPALGAGRRSVQQRIAARVGVTPLGLTRPPAGAALYELSASHTFGRTREGRCPHFVEEGGRCGIWRHRNSVCSTYFCKFERGAVGQRLWRSVGDLLAAVELGLSQWCVLELDVDPAALRELGPAGARPPIDVPALENRVDPARYRRLWGTWAGRERAFFAACARLVAPLRWDDVQRIGGAGVALRARLAVAAHRAHGAREIPERLVPGRFELLEQGRARILIRAYSDLDPVSLPRLVLDALPAFDGRPTAQVLRRIRSERGLDISPDLVRRLVDLEVLVAAPADRGD